MKGLVAYGDESDGGDSGPHSSSPHGKKRTKADDGTTRKMGSNPGSSARGGGLENPVSSQHRGDRTSTPPTLTNLNLSSTSASNSTTSSTTGISGIVIRKPPANHKHRNHPSSNSTAPPTAAPSSKNGWTERDTTTFVASAGGGTDSEMDISGDDADSRNPNDNEGEEQDELVQLRKLLRPPPIPGVEDWGIPPEPDEGAVDLDPEVLTKLSTFLQLKHHPTNPKHFNDSLMSNRSFRNPHLYANLVDWAGVKDEKVSNFPRDVWDAEGLQLEEGWYVEGLTEAQKRRADKMQREQELAKQQGGGIGKRRIEFASSTGSSTAASAKSGLYAHSNSSNSYLSHLGSGSAAAAASGRFQPYGSSGGAGGGGAREYSRERGHHSGSGKAGRWG